MSESLVNKNSQGFVIANKNPQGFVIIDLNLNSGRMFQSTDACMQFDFLGYEISVSTGGSVLQGGFLQEILVTDPEERPHFIQGSVQDAIMFVIQREQNRNFNEFTNAMSNKIEEV
ncbi:hypothetical protein DIDNDMLP_00165 [Klebsiella phage KP13-7]|uniref:hypothetical protein n=1 Tax=Klebsiella phage K64-1 TaxID=1439894 RepID=UPI00248CDB00|nr:hypothetical protein ACQ27_gp324 [Klebsiella phage K64-1]UYL05150.1 hypothetical protein DIDNDMLP_00165 [Klebsiella phage KP13-7]